MDVAEVLEQAGGRASVLCHGLAVEVAGLFPVRAGELLPPVLLGTGGPCTVRLSPSDLFRTAMLYRADEIVVVHNHLDGGPPSDADRRMTRRLRALGVALGLSLVGHLVITDGAHHVVD